MKYNCEDKYSSIVKDAKNEWNKYKNSVITEGNTPDVVICGSNELGLEIHGVTYGFGAIYFNSTTWAFLSTNEKLAI